MSKTDPPKPDLISANGIARRLNRSPQGVLDALQRLDIRPALTLATGKLYEPDTVEKVRAGMRQPNKKGSNVAAA